MRHTLDVHQKFCHHQPHQSALCCRVRHPSMKGWVCAANAARQVVHRDLKSLNLLLTCPVRGDDDPPAVKVDGCTCSALECCVTCQLVG